MSGRKAAEIRSDVKDDISASLAEVSAEVRKNLPDLEKVSGPKFRMSEGTREELERTGKATCPFTGRALTRDDL